MTGAAEARADTAGAALGLAAAPVDPPLQPVRTRTPTTPAAARARQAGTDIEAHSLASRVVRPEVWPLVAALCRPRSDQDPHHIGTKCASAHDGRSTSVNSRRGVGAVVPA